MSRSKEFYIDLANLEREFIAWLQRLMEAEGYTTIREHQHPGPGFARFRPDLVMLDQNQTRTIVELKLYRSDRTSPNLILNAARKLSEQREEAEAPSALLVVTSQLSGKLRARLIDMGVTTWDLQDLTTRSARSQELSEWLTDLLQMAQVGSPTTPISIARFSESTDSADLPPESEGEAIAVKLEASKAGRSNKAATEFEKLCVQALKLLFGKDFAGWKEQRQIEGGYQRMDVIARLVPVSPFWMTLASDFRTRYVVFEFKNYSSRVKQNEIFTTERYLYTAALRSVAVIVARKGCDENARRTMRGALREQGKLILCLSMEDICSLLRGWDAGEDPNNLLIERLDEMLMSIAR